MKNILLLFLLFSSLSYSQNQKYNLNFDQTSQGGELPDDWIKWGNYQIEKDSLNSYSGEYAAKISSGENGSSFGSIAYRIPARYKGHTLKLEGYIKTENVTNGFAGLLIRVDGLAGSLAFNNMKRQQLSGTNDWEKYKVFVRFPENAKTIYVGGILTGSGIAWFDNLKLEINGNKDVQDLEEVDIELKPAQIDSSFASNSNFKIKELSDLQEERLYKLGKVWGFVKYHHPEVAKGNVNWDNELFRILPKLNNENFDFELANCIISLGEVDSEEHKLPENDKVEIKPDHSWIYDKEFLSEDLSNELQKILTSKRENEHFYVSINPGVRNPSFTNETSYPEMEWDDTGIKLLALYRYWNMMEYFNPNNHLTDKDWEGVLREYIPRFVENNTELDYNLNMLQLIGEVGDTHAKMWGYGKVLSEFFGNRRLPLKVRFVEDMPVVVKVGDSAGSNIQIGDIITHIENKPIKEIIENNLRYYPASNYPTKLRDIARKLLWTNKESLELKLQNKVGSYEETVVSVEKWDDSEKIIPSHKYIENDIGYIYPESLKSGEIKDILNKFEDTKGIVVDMRCYPSDFIVFSMGNKVVPKPTDFVKFTNTSLNDPGYFDFRNGSKVGSYLKNAYDGKLTILINEDTQSNAEYTTMALRAAPEAVVIGSQTAGADGNVSPINLPGGIKTMISGIGVYYPDGTETQRIGIVPDIEIKPTIAGFRQGKDELLEKAIEVIRNTSDDTE
ncbi:S41 family peptidase [Christiangramia echinicola]|uniref:S41 family peptidase n=1 Tax=Christiangramia echinicola TaxID=279359 RepID=UPI000428D042|nr:S41 family peptidase [Christiangramia echinicola]